MDPAVLTDALTALVRPVTTMGAAIAPEIALVAAIGIGLGAVGFGIKYLWHMFKGTTK